jgi:hypothetical protein
VGRLLLGPMGHDPMLTTILSVLEDCVDSGIKWAKLSAQGIFFWGGDHPIWTPPLKPKYKLIFMYLELIIGLLDLHKLHLTLEAKK